MSVTRWCRCTGTDVFSKTVDSPMANANAVWPEAEPDEPGDEEAEAGLCLCRPKMNGFPLYTVTSSNFPSASISREGEDDRLRRGDELAATVDVLGVSARDRDGRAGILNRVSGMMVELLAMAGVLAVANVFVTRFGFLRAAWTSMAEAGRLKDNLTLVGLGCCDMMVRDGARGTDIGMKGCRTGDMEGIGVQDEDLEQRARRVESAREA